MCTTAAAAGATPPFAALSSADRKVAGLSVQLVLTFCHGVKGVLTGSALQVLVSNYHRIGEKDGSILYFDFGTAVYPEGVLR